MEKIQSAIAKARALRDGQTEVQEGTPAKKRVKPTPSKTNARPQDAEDVVKAWQALPTVKIDSRLLQKNHIVVDDGGQMAKSVDMMRTRVVQHMRDNTWTRLAITSPTVACGKSTVALNLALSLQRQRNLRIVLMDMDLRRPSLAKICGIDRAIGFADVINRTAPFEDNAVCYAPNLALCTNQHPQPNAAELFGSPNMSDVLAMIETVYAPDIMIFDTPPMLATDDMMALAPHVDCALLVAGAEATNVKEIDICERDLASQTNVMGVVLNKCRYMGPEYGYGYYD